MSQFAVIGLGRFGTAAALELLRLGHEVIGLDATAKRVNPLANKLSYAVIGDATDEQALREINVTSCDAVLVAIGENLEASILSVLHLKNIGVAEIWVKAASKPHHAILSRLGVSRIIHPEEEMGIRVAQALNYPMVNQYMALGHGQYLVEIEVIERLAGTRVADVLKGCDAIQGFLVKRREAIHSPVPPDFTLQAHDTLVLAGPLNLLQRIAPRLV